MPYRPRFHRRKVIFVTRNLSLIVYVWVMGQGSYGSRITKHDGTVGSDSTAPSPRCDTEPSCTLIGNANHSDCLSCLSIMSVIFDNSISQPHVVGGIIRKQESCSVLSQR